MAPVCSGSPEVSIPPRSDFRQALRLCRLRRPRHCVYEALGNGWGERPVRRKKTLERLELLIVRQFFEILHAIVDSLRTEPSLILREIQDRQQSEIEIFEHQLVEQLSEVDALQMLHNVSQFDVDFHRIIETRLQQMNRRYECRLDWSHRISRSILLRCGHLRQEVGRMIFPA